MDAIRVVRARRLRELEPGEGHIETALGLLLRECHEEARASPDVYKPVTMRSVEFLVDYVAPPATRPCRAVQTTRWFANSNLTAARPMPRQDP